MAANEKLDNRELESFWIAKKKKKKQATQWKNKVGENICKACILYKG